MRLEKVDSVFRVSRPFGEFFDWWMRFLRPIHKMSPQEMKVAAAFLKRRHVLHCAGHKDADSEAVSQSSRRAVGQELGFGTRHFYVLCSTLRKAGFIKDGRINPRFIPEYDGSGKFAAVIYFTFPDGTEAAKA